MIIIVLPIALAYVYLVRSEYIKNPFGGDEEVGDSTSMPSNYPAETLSYDVTESQAVFSIMEISPKDKSMLLRYILPYEREGTLVTVKIECPLNDSWIAEIDVNPDGEAPADPKFTLVSKPLYQIANPETDTLQGICSDLNCQSIVKSCELLRLVSEQ